MRAIKSPVSWLPGMLMLVCATLLSACHEEDLNIQAKITKEHIERHRWDFCTGLDRGIPPSSLARFPAAGTGEVLSGYVTNYIPGALPLPCNTFNQSKLQGIFSFGVYPNLRGANPSPEPFRGALLQLVSFRPTEGSINVDDEPSGGFGTGTITETRHTCRFKIMKVNEAWAPAHEGPDGFIPMSELAVRPALITVSSTGVVTPWQVDVSREAKSWYETGGEHGFAVVPEDPGYGAHKNNVCAGYFRFRLRAFIGADTPPSP